MLAKFLEWLDEHHVIDRKHIQDKDDTGFYTRFRIQKCVYLAQCLGLGTDYKYRPYVHGPYSKDLADDYSNDIKSDGREFPKEFDDEHQEAVLRAHSLGLAWLEVSTTIIQKAGELGENPEDYTRDAVERDVIDIKSQYTEDYIRTVYDDLLNTPLRITIPGTTSISG